MDLEEIFKRCSFKPNKQQKEAIETINGPLLIIAGPGSGKTEVLIYRTLNLILNYEVDPKNILLCTFTEKAAEQLKSRLKFYLSKCDKSDTDLSAMSCGTIHSICNDIIIDNISELPNLHKNFGVLEELTQILFIFENFDYIFGEKINDKYLSKWPGIWKTIQGSIKYFNKITEECIDISLMKKDSDNFVRFLADAYQRYKTKLEETNFIDFSFQQAHVLNLILNNSRIKEKLQTKYQYIMVDEYQDTNYVQEQIMLTIANKHNNICVVGDDDQAIYRFRGATVRNILEFESHFPKETVNKVNLFTNYRSYKKIINTYNNFMDSGIWEENGIQKFRFNKIIEADKTSELNSLDYESIIKINEYEENPKKVADLIIYLKENNIVKDLNQIAFFMRSIMINNTEPYFKEFERRNIPYYAPRSKKYFENKEIMEIVASIIQILSFSGDYIVDEEPFKEINDYCDSTWKLLEYNCKNNPDYLKLAQYLDNTSKKIISLKGNETTDKDLIDYFYEILSFKPFIDYLNDEEKARNLAIFSRLIILFQQYYKLYVITAKNLRRYVSSFFNSYLRFLKIQGLNEYEDPYDIFPSGKVQVMTIHQAKGLEFPVVFVAGLEKKNPPEDNIDLVLSKFYHRGEFEPHNRSQDFDQMRLSYVAFSRAENLLVLVSKGKPYKYFTDIFTLIPGYDEINLSTYKKIKIKIKPAKSHKLEYGFTSHINVYDICPKQYLMYKEYSFAPARDAQLVFGSLVHQTIEDIHKHIIENNPDKLDEDKIIQYFEKNKQGFIKKGIHVFLEKEALDQILNYFNNNKNEIFKVKETEVEIVVEEEDYLLKGVLDLIQGDNGKINILDFKSQKRPEDESKIIESYKKQLAIYSHIIEKKKGIKPDKTIIYWTGESEKEKAFMEINTEDSVISEVMEQFNEIVSKIRNKDFEVKKRPGGKICNDCDFRHCCNIDFDKNYEKQENY